MIGLSPAFNRLKKVIWRKRLRYINPNTNFEQIIMAGLVKVTGSSGPARTPHQCDISALAARAPVGLPSLLLGHDLKRRRTLAPTASPDIHLQ